MSKDVNYIVTGLGRSGTTYMMRCIEAGGIPVAKDTWRYELPKKHRFPILENFKGKCLKLFMHRLATYDDVSNCHILFMERNIYAILNSHLRFDGRVPLWLARCTKTGRGWKFDFRVYERKKKECEEKWRKQSKSYVVCKLENMDTYKHKLKFFKGLKKVGWPINPAAAASVNNDEEARIKKHGWKDRMQW